MFDLTIKDGRKQLAEHLVKEIDVYCVETYGSGHRKHLGASQIGKPCWRQLFYIFRWCAKEKFSGRMERLFNRGHREEARWLEWLRGIGWTVHELDPTTGEQYRIIDCEGHAGGSMDGIATNEKLFPGIEFLAEFKTFGTKTYGTLIKDGVQQFKPEHWGQMCRYGHRKQIKYAIYCPINKNDDDIQGLEIVELDWDLGASLAKKSEDIILMPAPPERISEEPSYIDCRICFARGICHFNQPVEKNCRSCRHSFPKVNGEWGCRFFQYNTIPPAFIPIGCENHIGIS